MEKKAKKETDFGKVSEWLAGNVLPMLEEECKNPLEAIYLLTSFAKNASLTIGVTAGLPPKKVMEACISIFQKEDYNDAALTKLAEGVSKKIDENDGFINPSYIFDIMNKMN